MTKEDLINYPPVYLEENNINRLLLDMATSIDSVLNFLPIDSDESKEILRNCYDLLRDVCQNCRIEAITTTSNVIFIDPNSTEEEKKEIFKQRDILLKELHQEFIPKRIKKLEKELEELRGKLDE